jgi:hypothetical protein
VQEASRGMGWRAGRLMADMAEMKGEDAK